LFKENTPRDWIAFQESMEKAGGISFQTLQHEKWKWLEQLYNRGLSKKNRPKIPKIIHQIWLGGPLPEKYKEWQKSWSLKNPGWQYRLWTDADLEHFPFTDRKRFEQSPGPGERADILRYDILYHFGGLYVDTDFECLQAFDKVHESCDFYVGLEAAFEVDQEPGIGTALIGSVAGHPILLDCLQEISKKAPGQTPHEVMSVSGPGCMRKAFFKKKNQKGYRNIAFPYTFFYPIPSPCRNEEKKREWIEPESLAVHYWDVSWVR
jgi:mannosyltransferase OCH1-like enzyme